MQQQLLKYSDLNKGHSFFVEKAWWRLVRRDPFPPADFRPMTAEEVEDHLVRRLGLTARLLKAEAMAEKRIKDLAVQRARENQGVGYYTLCASTSCYGGPEEGGWYYVDSTPVHPDAHFSVLLTVTCHGFPIAMGKAERLNKLLNRLLERYTPELEALGITTPYTTNAGGIGGCADDEDMNLDASIGDAGYSWEFTIGAPFTGRARPRYE